MTQSRTTRIALGVAAGVVVLLAGLAGWALRPADTTDVASDGGGAVATAEVTEAAGSESTTTTDSALSDADDEVLAQTETADETDGATDGATTNDDDAASDTATDDGEGTSDDAATNNADAAGDADAAKDNDATEGSTTGSNGTNASEGADTSDTDATDGSGAKDTAGSAADSSTGSDDASGTTGSAGTTGGTANATELQLSDSPPVPSAPATGAALTPTCGLDRLVIYAGAQYSNIGQSMRAALPQLGFGSECAEPVTVLAANCPLQFSGVLAAGSGYDPLKPYVATSAAVDSASLGEILDIIVDADAAIETLDFSYSEPDAAGERWVAVFIPPSFDGWSRLAGAAGVTATPASLCTSDGRTG